MDFIKFATRPEEWGITKMMKRIEAIEQRFAVRPPDLSGGGDFKAELQKSMLGDAGADKNETTNETDLFAPGAFSDAAPKETRYDPMIAEAARKYNLDEDLLRAIIQAESGFNPQALSPKGAMGLMQLMPGTAQSLNVTNPYDPAQNIDGGARYLRSMLDRFGGDTGLALSAYNAGPKAVETYKGVPPYQETQNYVRRILGMLPGT